jgi:hypothetical protein
MFKGKNEDPSAVWIHTKIGLKNLTSFRIGQT